MDPLASFYQAEKQKITLGVETGHKVVMDVNSPVRHSHDSKRTGSSKMEKTGFELSKSIMWSQGVSEASMSPYKPISPRVEGRRYSCHVST
jgi:hypothetical protein